MARPRRLFAHPREWHRRRARFLLAVLAGLLLAAAFVGAAARFEPAEETPLEPSGARARAAATREGACVAVDLDVPESANARVRVACPPGAARSPRDDAPRADAPRPEPPAQEVPPARADAPSAGQGPTPGTPGHPTGAPSPAPGEAPRAPDTPPVPPAHTPPPPVARSAPPDPQPEPSGPAAPAQGIEAEPPASSEGWRARVLAAGREALAEAIARAWEAASGREPAENRSSSREAAPPPEGDATRPPGAFPADRPPGPFEGHAPRIEDARAPDGAGPARPFAAEAEERRGLFAEEPRERGADASDATPARMREGARAPPCVSSCAGSLAAAFGLAPAHAVDDADRGRTAGLLERLIGTLRAYLGVG